MNYEVLTEQQWLPSRLAARLTGRPLYKNGTVATTATTRASLYSSASLRKAARRSVVDLHTDDEGAAAVLLPFAACKWAGWLTAVEAVARQLHPKQLLRAHDESSSNWTVIE